MSFLMFYITGQGIGTWGKVLPSAEQHMVVSPPGVAKAPSLVMAIANITLHKPLSTRAFDKSVKVVFRS